MQGSPSVTLAMSSVNSFMSGADLYDAMCAAGRNVTKSAAENAKDDLTFGCVVHEVNSKAELSLVFHKPSFCNRVDGVG